MLGQRKVDDKPNGMTAIPQLLDVLALEGCIVTIDAIGTQTKIASAIVEHGADYVLSVKANQATLLDDIRYVFQEDQVHHFQEGPYDYAKTVDKGHGRLELRECGSISAPEYLLCLRDAHKWAALKSLVMLKVERRIGRQREVNLRYYISSLNTSAADFLRITRSHWGIENGLHWELDIAFREDDSRVRNFALRQNTAELPVPAVPSVTSSVINLTSLALGFIGLGAIIWLGLMQHQRARVTSFNAWARADLRLRSEAERQALNERYLQRYRRIVDHLVLDGGKLVVAHAGMKAEMQGRIGGRVRNFALY